MNFKYNSQANNFHIITTWIALDMNDSNYNFLNSNYKVNFIRWGHVWVWPNKTFFMFDSFYFLPFQPIMMTMIVGCLNGFGYAYSLVKY